MKGFKAESLSVAIFGKQLFHPLSFEILPGQVCVVVGSSGSGKSCLLSYIAGTLDKSILGKGRLFIGETRIDVLPTRERKVGIMFQDDLLFSHLTIGENLLYAMTQKASKNERLEYCRQALANVGLDGFMNRLPQTLSGGQRSRVSLLRSLLAKPDLILLDEPFSKLDKNLRSSFRTFVFDEIRQRNIPCVLVTHDESDIPCGAQILSLLPICNEPP